MDFSGMCPARWLSDPNFGMCVTPHDFMYPFFDMHTNYYRPWKWGNQRISKEFGSTIENEKGNYKITLDVQHYRSNEINVKVTDKEIIVEGKHEERPDAHGYVTRQFNRRYPLPSHCPPEYVTSSLSSDGVLIIIAEKRLCREMEKIVPIKLCGTCPRKAQFETKISSEITQKTQKENLKDTEDILNRNRSQVMLREDHCRLLKPELLKEAILETNGTCTEKATAKESIGIMKTPEKIDTLNIGGTSNKIEESLGKSILGLTALTEQLGQSSLASTSGGMRSASDTCGIKSASDMCGVKSATESFDMKCETSSMKGASEKSNMKGASETGNLRGASEINTLKSTSEMCGKTGTSKTLIEESSSSYKSTSSMSSSTRISSKTGECFSDIVATELREAAENV